MNKARRKDLDKVISLLVLALSIIETARDDEQDGFDNLSAAAPEAVDGGVIFHTKPITDAVYNVETGVIEAAKGD